MKCVLTLLLFCTCAYGAEKIKPTKKIGWYGTNSFGSILLWHRPDGSPVNGRVQLNGNAIKYTYPAHAYGGANGYVTVDYGYGIDPGKVIQFRILKVTGSKMECISDNSDTSRDGYPDEKFFLYKIK
jgi:hypothetical protein